MIEECRGRGWRARKRAETLLQSRLYVLNRRSAWSVIPLGTYYLGGKYIRSKGRRRDGQRRRGGRQEGGGGGGKSESCGRDDLTQAV